MFTWLHFNTSSSWLLLNLVQTNAALIASLLAHKLNSFNEKNSDKYDALTKLSALIALHSSLRLCHPPTASGMKFQKLSNPAVDVVLHKIQSTKATKITELRSYSLYCYYCHRRHFCCRRCCCYCARSSTRYVRRYLLNEKRLRRAVSFVMLVCSIQ